MSIKLQALHAVLLEIRDELYQDMLDTSDCGPFDGCCFVFASALQKVIGGQVAVLINENGRADHAALFIDGKLFDYDGPLEPESFMKRFEANEFRKIIEWRMIQDEDLLCAVRDTSLINLLSNKMDATFSLRQAA